MAITDLTGTTWRINEVPVVSTQFQPTIFFTANNSDYVVFVGIPTSPGNCIITYSPQTGSSVQAYNSQSGWNTTGGADYRTIVISEDQHGQTGVTNSAFIAWLEANAVQVIPAVTISYNSNTIATMDESGTEVLETNGKIMADDITIEYHEPGIPGGMAGTPVATKGTVSNHSVSVTPSVTNATGYITGGTITGSPVTVSASELVSGTLSITSGGSHSVGDYEAVSVPYGSATAPTSISETGATVSTGTNTLTLTKSVWVTPSVTAGYVSSGVSGNSSVTLTATVPTKAATTYLPTTINRTIVDAGTYLTGAQTILGDSNLVAANIKKDVSIFGVTGTYEGSGGGESITFRVSSKVGTPMLYYVDSDGQVVNPTVTASDEYTMMKGTIFVAIASTSAVAAPITWTDDGEFYPPKLIRTQAVASGTARRNVCIYQAEYADHHISI